MGAGVARGQRCVQGEGILGPPQLRPPPPTARLVGRYTPLLWGGNRVVNRRGQGPPVPREPIPTTARRKGRLPLLLDVLLRGAN